MRNLKKLFENNKPLFLFLTCGDPDLETTEKAILKAEENGADLIELALAFSDPTAESPSLQNSSTRALKNGTTTDKAFEFLLSLRKKTKISIALSAYANVVFSFGAERFLSLCKQAEVDALIINDLPFEEKEEFLPYCKQFGIELISCVAAAKKERISSIAKEANGFISVIPASSHEIYSKEIVSKAADICEVVKNSTDTPFVLSFSSPSKEDVLNCSSIANGIEIVCAAVDILQEKGKDAPEHIGKYVKEIKSLLK